MPIHSFFVFFDTLPPNDVTRRTYPQKDGPWAEPRHLRHKARTSVARFELGVGARKNSKTGKKSQKGYISPICGEASTETMYMKYCLAGDVLDVITCA